MHDTAKDLAHFVTPSLKAFLPNQTEIMHAFS